MKKISLLIAILCVALTSVLPLRAAVDNKAEGKRLCQLGQYREALPFLEKAVKQSRKSGALWYLAITRQHLYDFDGAVEAAETYRTVLNSDEWLERADSLLEVLNICRRAFDHTQDVVIVDSMLVDAHDFFAHYQLGAESGRILQDDEDGAFYENQVGDYRIYSDGEQLFETHKFNGQWEERQPLQGIGTEDFTIRYPFMRSDGSTLYFACDSIPGMGGYDIYRTSYSNEEGAYYQPERLGMPFNSPYNDYMMAIDETHQVGWWATDRNAPEGKVTIYLFLYEEDPAYLDEPTPSRARIDCIAETWREAGGYASLLDELRQAPQQPVQVAPLLHIVINDDRVYTSTDQFRSPKALAAYQRSVELTEQIAQLEQTLTATRAEYSRSNASQKKALEPRLLKAEDSLITLYQQQREAVLQYRRLEQ